MKEKKTGNYAFIDGQNLNLGIRELGWHLDYKRFRIYLREKYGVEKAYYFIGYLEESRILYKFLQEAGYILIFKPIIKDSEGRAKGNVDADLVLQTMIDFPEYEKAVIVTSDGDFYCLVRYLYEKNKLRVVLSPNREKCSALLKKTAREKLFFMNDLKRKLAYKK
jgi:uncharacterized LabA/DUF88 family protein